MLCRDLFLLKWGRDKKFTSLGIHKTKAIDQQPVHCSYEFTIHCVVLKKTDLRLNKGARKCESLLVWFCYYCTAMVIVGGGIVGYLQANKIDSELCHGWMLSL